MKIYYLHDGSEQNGPYSLEELKAMNLSGNVHVWFEGQSSWQRLQDISELSDIITAAPPPFIQPPPIILPSSRQNSLSLSKGKIIFGVLLLLLVVSFSIWILRGITRSKSANNTTVEVSQPSIDSASYKAKIVAEEKKKAQKEQQRIELEKEKQFFRQKWHEFIIYDVGKDKKVGLLGGISNVFLNISNLLPYDIEIIEFRISYIKSNGDVYHQEERAIAQIPKGGSQTYKLPDTSRGVRLETEVLRIHCKGIDLCYDINISHESPQWGDGTDMYRCSE